jgi:hypothetical protein
VSWSICDISPVNPEDDKVVDFGDEPRWTDSDGEDD